MLCLDRDGLGDLCRGLLSASKHYQQLTMVDNVDGAMGWSSSKLLVSFRCGITSSLTLGCAGAGPNRRHPRGPPHHLSEARGDGIKISVTFGRVQDGETRPW